MPEYDYAAYDRIAAAMAAGEAPFDPTNAEIITDRAPAKVVYSTRISPEYSDDIAAEATRCGQNPSQLIADLVVEALRARKELAEVVTINMADLNHAIHEIARRAA